MNSKSIVYRESHTLLCLLSGLTGKIATIEQLNEHKITGKIDYVDEYMNIQMSNVSVRDLNNKSTKFELLQIRGNRIRFVVLPDDIDIEDTIERRIDYIHSDYKHANAENKLHSKEGQLINKKRLEKESIPEHIQEYNRALKLSLKKESLNKKYKSQMELLKEQMKKKK